MFSVILVRAGGDGVDGDAVALELTSQDPGQGEDGPLGRRVVGLARAAEQAGLRRGVDDPTGDRVPRLGQVPPIDGGMVGCGEVPLEMDTDHVVPVGLLEVEGHLVPDDAGVVHQDVQLPERLDGLVYQRLGSLPGADVVGR